MRSKKVITSDFVIIGGGVIGLSVARRLSALYPNSKIKMLEKEKKGLGTHTSGRNSGVLHAGFYYTSNSQKAKYSVEGNKQWREYCQKFDLPIKYTGKYVVMPCGGDRTTFL
jgi:L-2-hydroxyglutarate oxidase